MARSAGGNNTLTGWPGLLHPPRGDTSDIKPSFLLAMSRVRILMAVALVLLPLSHAQCDPGFYENEQQECTACASGQYQVRWGAAVITGRLRLQFSSRD